MTGAHHEPNRPRKPGIWAAALAVAAALFAAPFAMVAHARVAGCKDEEAAMKSQCKEYELCPDYQTCAELAADGACDKVGSAWWAHSVCSLACNPRCEVPAILF